MANQLELISVYDQNTQYISLLQRVNKVDALDHGWHNCFCVVIIFRLNLARFP